MAWDNISQNYFSRENNVILVILLAIYSMCILYTQVGCFFLPSISSMYFKTYTPHTHTQNKYLKQ